MLTACGPAKPDGDSPDTSTADPGTTVGADATTADIDPGTTTTRPTTTLLDPTTGAPGTTTSDDTDADTGPTIDPPSSILIMMFLPYTDGEGHAFTELPAWQPEMPAPDCEGAPPVCDGNTAPKFGAPQLLLNGAWVDPTTPIHAGDRVGLAYPFVDAECNVACGWSNTFSETPDSAGDTGGSLEAFPCESGPGLGFEFSEVDQPGLYRYSLRLSDACEATGELLGEFTVLP